jgi:hypothetical protein
MLMTEIHQNLTYEHANLNRSDETENSSMNSLSNYYESARCRPPISAADYLITVRWALSAAEQVIAAFVGIYIFIHSVTLVLSSDERVMTLQDTWHPVNDVLVIKNVTRFSGDIIR